MDTKNITYLERKRREVKLYAFFVY